jgi:hypothetical protein
MVLRHRDGFSQGRHVVLIHGSELSQGVNLLASLEEGRSLAFHAFESRSTGVVAGPIGVFSRGIGEKVVVFGRPRHVGLIEGMEITRGGRVEEIYLGSVGLLPKEVLLERSWDATKSTLTRALTYFISLSRFLNQTWAFW